MKQNFKKVTIILLFSIFIVFLGCEGESDNTLAPYEGSRELEILKVTKNFVPEIQWVGGRVAAVGVNKGNRAALDSTLVWLMTAEDNAISSSVKFATNTDIEKLLSLGGSPIDSLEDEAEYTFWIAEKEAYDFELDTTLIDAFNFSDTSTTTSLIFPGRPGGEKDAARDLVVTMTIFREETLLQDKFIIDWVPNDIPFRRIVVREGTSGGWTDIMWHVVLPDSIEDNIYPPVIIGEAPEGTFEAVEWPASGFEVDKVYFIWMANENWTESDFGRSAVGYAYYQIFKILDL